MHDYYAAKLSIKAFLGLLARFDDDDCNALVADVIARNPDRKIQAAAYREQIPNCEGLAQVSESLKDPKQLEEQRKNATRQRDCEGDRQGRKGPE